jgi:fumarate hydratase class I
MSYSPHSPINKETIITYVYHCLQYISYCHSKDFIDAMTNAYHKEQNTAAKNAIKQILINSQLSAQHKRPMCQDTGIVNIFIEIGMSVQWEGDFDLEDAINCGIRKAYTDPSNPLRASIVNDPLFTRTNTKDNTPGVISYTFVKGDAVKLKIAAKGCGSENKTKFAVLNPSDDIFEWVMQQIPTMGAGWCPPGVLSIGVGGTVEKAMLLAKKALTEHIDIHTLQEKRSLNQPLNNIEKLRLKLVDAINNLNIGAQGLGGLTTVLDVKITDYPTHAASLPIALIANCAAERHIDITIGDPLPQPDMSIYPQLQMDYNNYTKVNLDTLTKQDITQWRNGDNLLLTGTLYTARDAAHKRLQQMLHNGEPLPVDLNNKFIYYVGPVDSITGEAIGPAGPTTATRMDKFSKDILQTGCLGAIGKAERGKQAAQEFTKQGCVYLIAVGGAAYLIAKTVKKSEIVTFEDLGMEAIYKLEVENMPVSVAIDTNGNNIHQEITF